jgi:hypothetical protein
MKKQSKKASFFKALFKAKAVLFFLGFFLSVNQISFAAYEVGEHPETGEPTLYRVTTGGAQENDTDCVTDQEIETFLSALTSYKSYLLLPLPTFKTELKEAIRGHLSSCTRISQSEVDALLYEKLAKTPKVVGAAVVLSGSYVAWNYGMPIVQQHMPTWLQPSFPSLALVVSMNLLAPYLDPLSAKVRYLFFNFGKSDLNKSLESLSAEFIQIWYRTNENLTLNEEMGRNILYLAHNTLNIALTGIAVDFAILILNKVPEDELLTFLTKRIEFEMYYYKLNMPDVLPGTHFIQENVRSRLTIYKNFFNANFKKDLVEGFRTRDPQFEEAKDYYEKIINLWIPSSEELQNKDMDNNSIHIQIMDEKTPLVGVIVDVI